MNKSKKNGMRHYSNLEQAEEYVRRKLQLEAKLTIHKKGDEIKKEQNRLRKNKSLLLDRIEDGFEAALYLIEASDQSESKDDATKIISPEYLLKSLDIQQQKKKKRDLQDVKYFQEKISREFHDITKRIFSTKRMDRLAFGIFAGMTRQILLEEEKGYRVEIANILLQRTIDELEADLPNEYSNILREDFERTRNLAGIINYSINRKI